MPSADFIKTVSTVRYVGVSGSVIFASNGDREGYIPLSSPPLPSPLLPPLLSPFPLYN